MEAATSGSGRRAPGLLGLTLLYWGRGDSRGSKAGDEKMQIRRNLLASVQGSIQFLGAGRKFGLVLLLCVGLGSFGWLISRKGETQQVWLFGEQRFSGKQLEAMAAALRLAHMREFAVEGDRIKVPQDEAARYLAVLAQRRELPYRFFEEVLQRRSWLTSQGDLERHLELAAQQALAEVIGAFDGIEQAWVSWTATPKSGFGRNQDVRASVAIKTNSGSRLSERTEQAIKDLVVGSRAGLSRDKVSVIDMSGQTADPPASRIEQDRLRYVKDIEEHYTEKLSKLLAFIDNAIVSVNVELARSDWSQPSAESEPTPVESVGAVGSWPQRKSVPADEREPIEQATPDEEGQDGLASVSSQRPVSLDNAVLQAKSDADEEVSEAVTHGSEANQLRMAVAVGIPESYFRGPGAGKVSAATDAVERGREESIRRLIVAALPSLATSVEVSIHRYGSGADQAVTSESFAAHLRGSQPVMYVAAGILVLALAVILTVRSATRRAKRVGRSRLSQAAPLLAAAGSAPERRVHRDDDLSQELQQMVHRNPKHAADILESWIRQGTEQ